MSKLLLVHGGWMDGRCWDLLHPHLRKRGISAETITLRGNGPARRGVFGASMTHNAAEITEKMSQMGGPVTLLGHSMGGYSISAAAQMSPELVKAMIYLAAWVPPKSGDSMAQTDRRLGARITGPLVRRAVRWQLLRGTIAVDPKLGAAFLCQLADEDARNFLFSTINPQPMRPGFSKVPWTDDRLGQIPKSYIECTLDAAIPISGQRHFQKNMAFARVERLASDHAPFVSMPENLAETIAALV